MLPVACVRESVCVCCCPLLLRVCVAVVLCCCAVTVCYCSVTFCCECVFLCVCCCAVIVYCYSVTKQLHFVTIYSDLVGCVWLGVKVTKCYSLLSWWHERVTFCYYLLGRAAGIPPSKDLPFQEYGGEVLKKKIVTKKLQITTIYKHVSDDWKGNDVAL